LSFTFNVAPNMPTITQITPGQGTANTPVTIYGTNLTGAGSVEFYGSNGQIVASTPNFSSVSNSSVSFTIPQSFSGMVPAGTYQVDVVTNLCPAGCNSNRLSFTFNVAPNMPTITQITPGQGTANTPVTIYGTNLTGATEVDFYNGNTFAAGISNSVQQNITVASGGQSLNFALSGAFGGMVDAGTYQVKVVTPAGTSNGLSFAFTPTAANAPYITVTAPAGSGNSTPSMQALQQQLVQLITLLLQLLQQAAAKGLLTQSQLNAALNVISH
jgi:hypothetical protein